MDPKTLLELLIAIIELFACPFKWITKLFSKHSVADRLVEAVIEKAWDCLEDLARKDHSDVRVDVSDDFVIRVSFITDKPLSNEVRAHIRRQLKHVAKRIKRRSTLKIFFDDYAE